MKKIKINKYRKIKIEILFLIILCFFIMVVQYVQNVVEPQLHSLAIQHTGYVIHYVVKEAIGKMNYDVNDFMNVEYDSNGEMTNITYDTKMMNKYLSQVLNIIDDTLQRETTNDKKIKNGVIYEAKLGYFLHSYILSNLGPTFKIKLQTCHDASGNIVTETDPYGVDNTLLKISLVVDVNAKVSTYINSYDVSKKVKIPLVIQIVKGNVSSMYPYSLPK